MNFETLALAKQYTNSQRQAWVEETAEPMIGEVTVEISGTSTRISDYADSDSPMLVPGNRNLVIWDGKPYRCVTVLGTGTGSTQLYVGNASIASTAGYADTGEPFCLRIPASGDRATVWGSPGTHTLEVLNIVDTIVPVDQKYIPALDSVTMNSADGKQYKLYVNESGELTAAEVV